MIVFNVTPRPDGTWEIDREPHRVLVSGSVHATREQALERADELAREQAPSCVKIRREDGSVEREYTLH